MIRLREYQDASITSVLDYWTGGGGNPLVDLATGLGKSVVIAQLTKLLIADFPRLRVLMLVDSKELVEQNFLALVRSWPQAPAGVYAAGLGRRDLHHQIVFASIQSVYRRAKDLGPFDLVLIDEAHMVPHEGEGRYRTFLAAMRELSPHMRVCGFTATAFRLKGGSISAGEGALFDDVVFSFGIGKGIEEGWLSRLVSKPGTVAAEIDVSKVARSGGEFKPGALQDAADQDDVIKAAVQDMIRLAGDRKSWLVFCTGVDHALNTRDALREAGISCETVTGDTDPGERARSIEAFKSGRLHALTNAEVLTKGFDAPRTDMVAMLRPTLSPGLLLQIIGRGTRPIYPAGFNPNDATAAERKQAMAEGPKPNCLVLDFSGNIRRHGPVDTITVGAKKGAGPKDPNAIKPDSVRAKTCPNCLAFAALAARTCEDCGHEWEYDDTPNHVKEAEDVAIMSCDLPKVSLLDELPVQAWRNVKHEKFGAPPSMKILYSAGVAEYPEWITFEHKGHAADKAARWWGQHGGFDPHPRTTDEAIARFGELRQPAFITTKKNGKWFDITGRRFALSPEATA